MYSELELKFILKIQIEKCLWVISFRCWIRYEGRTSLDWEAQSLWDHYQRLPNMWFMSTGWPRNIFSRVNHPRKKEKARQNASAYKALPECSMFTSDSRCKMTSDSASQLKGAWWANPRQCLSLINLLDQFLGEQLNRSFHPVLSQMLESKVNILVVRSQSFSGKKFWSCYSRVSSACTGPPVI